MSMAILALLVTLGGLLWTVPGEAAEAQGASGGPFRARPVQAKDLRWQDVSDCHYAPAFRAAFSYQRTAPLLEARISAGEAKPFGHLRARRLKPNFAYQLKLCGRGSLLGSTEAENGLNAEAWANWELGRQGRWWCEECRWNVGDWDLRWHLSRGHHVNGYLLFGWFVTDAQGAAEVDFRVLSSYHVLWKVDQRRPATSEQPGEPHHGDRIEPPAAAQRRRDRAERVELGRQRTRSPQGNNPDVETPGGQLGGQQARLARRPVVVEAVEQMDDQRPAHGFGPSSRISSGSSAAI